MNMFGKLTKQSATVCRVTKSKCKINQKSCTSSKVNAQSSTQLRVLEAARIYTKNFQPLYILSAHLTFWIVYPGGSCPVSFLGPQPPGGPPAPLPVSRAVCKSRGRAKGWQTDDPGKIKAPLSLIFGLTSTRICVKHSFTYIVDFSFNSRPRCRMVQINEVECAYLSMASAVRSTLSAMVRPSQP